MERFDSMPNWPLFITIFFGLMASVALSQTHAGKILFADGQVQILSSDGQSFRNALPGGAFFVGETIATDGSSSSRLRFREGNNEITIGPNSALLIERASVEGLVNGTTLKLHYGNIRPFLKIPYSDLGEDSFRVKTPLAEASLRGTSFVAHHDSTIPESSFVALDGVINVRSGSVSDFSASPIVSLETGEFVKSNPSVSVSTPAPVSENMELVGEIRRINKIAEGKLTDVYDETGVAPWDASTLSRSLAQGPRHRTPVANESLANKISRKTQSPKTEGVTEIPVTSKVEAIGENTSDVSGESEPGPKKKSKPEVFERILVEALGI